MTQQQPLSAQISDALEALDPNLGSLEAASALKKSMSPNMVRQAVELHQLRQRAASKMGTAPNGLLLTKKGYEQATGRQVADFRAARIAAWAAQTRPTPWVLDGTAGIGGDSMALLRAGVQRLLSNELDGLSAGMLRSNLLGIRPGASVVRSRIESGSLKADALLLDPDRRESRTDAGARAGSREGNPERWAPPWSACLELLQSFPNVCIKLAPGSDIERFSLPSSLTRAWQWISMGGELKEATLWTGAWAAFEGHGPGFQLGCGALQRNVSVLARDGSLRAHWCAEPLELEPLPLELARATSWICEPDPALIRAGLVGALGAASNMQPLARDCVYLGGPARAAEGLAASYRVLAHCALDKKRVRAMLRENGVGSLVVKKRGHPATADELAKRYGGKTGPKGLLIVARLGNNHHAYLVDQPKRTK